MIKIILQMACSLLFIFALTSGVSIQFKPFHISFAYPFFGLGMVLITIGFALCVGSFYYKDMKKVIVRALTLGPNMLLT